MSILERQYPLVALIKFAVTDFYDVTGAPLTSIVVGRLPANAVVTNMFMEVTEAVDGTNTVTSAAGTAGAVPAATAVGRVGGTGLGIVGANPEEITITRSAAPAAGSTGAGYVYIEYVIPNRQNEVQT